jgi:hypothetical protein
MVSTIIILSIALVISVLDFLGIGRALAVPPADVEEGGRDAERLQTIFEELTAMKVCVCILHLSVVISSQVSLRRMTFKNAAGPWATTKK